jgi:serine/threonine-protein kinase
MRNTREGGEVKTHLGHYEVVSELGRGGMGVVYKGYEAALARYVAIKELSPTLAHDPGVVERFLREARSMALLNDPHIIQIYSIGQENDLPFFVMEFVDGSSVAALIEREHHLQPGDALKIVHQTAKGLMAAHDRGVIHRDIKPANLIVSLRGQVKIADFGIALANADMSAKLTSAGEMVGTPGYLPPELLLGQSVDQRSDIYALGVVLFEMLTGRTPFSDASVYKLMLNVVQSEVPDVREINSEIDPGVAAILAKMLIKDPGKRYQRMQDLIADLDKHPLVANGGPLKVGVRATSGDTTGLHIPHPVHSAAAARAPTPPPVMGRTPPIVTPTNISAAATPAPAPITPSTPAPAAAPGVQATTPAPVAANAPAAREPKSYWPFVVFLMAVVASIAIWMYRAQILAEAQANSPDRNQLITWWRGAEEVGARQLAPILRQLNIHVAPELVFDGLVLLVVLLLIRNAFARLARARNRRAYERKQARGAP